MFDHVGSQFGYGEPGQFRRNALEFEEVPYKVSGGTNRNRIIRKLIRGALVTRSETLYVGSLPVNQEKETPKPADSGARNSETSASSWVAEQGPESARKNRSNLRAERASTQQIHRPQYEVPRPPSGSSVG